MGELWLGSTTREFVFKKRKMFCFQKGLVQQVMPWARLDGKSGGRFWKTKKRKGFKGLSKPSRSRGDFYRRKVFYKIALHLKLLLQQINKAPPTHCIYIFHLPVHGRRWTCWVLCTQSLFCCCFSEEKTRSCKGYTCTQLACGIWAVVMSPLRILDFLPQVLVLFVLIECVVDQFLKLLDMLGL